MSFFARGYDKSDEYQQKVKEQRQAEYDSRKPQRLFVKPGKEVEIIFVDDDPITFKEHWLRVGGKYDPADRYTCLEQRQPDGTFSPCPFIDGKYHNPYMVSLWTVLDGSEWEDKRGVKHKWEPKIMDLRQDDYDILKRKRKSQGGNLVGCKFRLYRTEKKNDRDKTKLDFEFVERVKLEEFGNPKIFEYAKLFVPVSFKAAEEIQARSGGGFVPRNDEPVSTRSSRDDSSREEQAPPPGDVDAVPF